MATKIRMTRMGSKKSPSYRIVVTDSRNARGAEYTDQIGFYNPLSNPVDLRIDKEKAEKWLKTGAIPTDTAKSLLVQAGIELPEKKSKKVASDKEKTSSEKVRKTTKK